MHHDTIRLSRLSLRCSGSWVGWLPFVCMFLVLVDISLMEEVLPVLMVLLAPSPCLIKRICSHYIWHISAVVFVIFYY